MAATFSSWTAVGEALRAHGVATAFVKQLAPNQDNEKNQIYLAYQKGANPFTLIEHILPLTFGERASSTSEKKERSDAGSPILQGTVKWHWVMRDGTAHLAPQTRVIFYLQYPEIRLSGFIAGCNDFAPDAVRRERMDGYGSRALVFGTGSGGAVYALVVTEKEDPSLFSTNLLDGPPVRGTKRRSVMRIAGLTRHSYNAALYYFEVIADGIPRLLADLRRIHARGWIPSQRLVRRDQAPRPFRGKQGGGYTLEALLDIPSNASKEPDRDGVEVKSFSKPKVSLMTPTPDGGVQGNQGLLPFLLKYGYEDKSDPTCRKFNGTHKCGVLNAKTGLTLRVAGYETGKGFLGPETEALVALVDSSGETAASWSFTRLFESWNKKHAKAVYVSSRKRMRHADPDHDADYLLAETVWVCEGTSARHLLDAILAGDVVYDPGDTSKSSKTGKPKPRPQWRVRGLKHLYKLYENVRKVTYP